VSEHPFRLVVSDVDGTLQDSIHHISAYTIRVIRCLPEKGILFTISTGKLLPAVQEPAQRLGIQIPLITSNGSVLQYANGQMIHAKYIDPQVVHRIIQLVSPYEVDITVCTPLSVYTRRITAGVRAMMDFGPPQPREIPSWEYLGGDVKQVIKLVLLNLNGPSALAPVADILSRNLDGRVSCFPTMPYMLEVLPPGENKASGLRRLADHLHIQLAEIITIGDGDNDVVMHQQAGLSAAVVNGTPACRASADVLIDSNDHEGPARFLAGLVKSC